MYINLKTTKAITYLVIKTIEKQLIPATIKVNSNPFLTDFL